MTLSTRDKKLVEAYAVVVQANKYILNEKERTNLNQKLVPENLVDEVKIKIAENKIDKLSNTP